MSVRDPAVAGMFYRAGAAELKDQIEECFLGPGSPGTLPVIESPGARNILGLVCPHAGFMYSGAVAAHAYSRLAEDGLPDVAVILGPNHRSYKPAAALSDHTSWRTPLGEMEIDSGIAASIARACPSARMDSAAFYGEHSLEVQLPFLQYLAELGSANIRIVPILIGAAAYGTSSEFIQTLGSAIADALSGRNAVIIASTDFSHYESSESAARRDSEAISKIVAMDEEGLVQTVEAMEITMCGALPTAVTIAACKRLGASSAAKLVYRTSGDVTGDYSSVVAYAALELTKPEMK